MGSDRTAQLIMKFKVDRKIFEDFGNPVIGIIVVGNIDNTVNNPEISRLLREAETDLRKKMTGVDIPTHPNIAPWREAYRKFGSKPNEFRSSPEALTRIVLRGSEIRSINPLVDLYNLISIKYIIPVGAEDLDKMEGDLALTFADGTEEYIPLGEEKNDPPKYGEVIYRDDTGVICRRWNWREGDRTKITPETKNAVVVLESIASIPIENAVEELSSFIKKYCGGETKVFYLTKDISEVKLD